MDTELRLDDNLVIDTSDTVRCAHCRTALGQRGENYLDHALRREGPPTEAGPHIRPGDASLFVDQPMVFRQYSCPGCYVALLTEIVPAAEPTLRQKVV